MYRWVGKGDSRIVTISSIMEYACISVHVALLCTIIDVLEVTVSSDPLIDHLLLIIYQLYFIADESISLLFIFTNILCKFLLQNMTFL